MRRIDGGAGGGQLVRWAVAMSAVRDQPVEIVNIRGAREPPGLRPQHVASITAASRFTDATVTGVEVGSESVTFEPAGVSGGRASIDVGTAGSVTLVIDTILPLAHRSEEPIVLDVTGGTDVKWSPPVDYHRYVKFPVLSRSGLAAELELDRRGFYPKGGGSVTLTLEPTALEPLSLVDKGEIESIEVHSIATEDLEDADVAERQAEAAEEQLADVVSAPIEAQWESTPAPSTGSVVIVVVEYEGTRAGFSALGEPGKRAEKVAGSAVADFEAFHSASAAVDPYLADQLLPFLAVGGGEFTTTERTAHVETALDLLSVFGYDIDVSETDEGVLLAASP